MRIVAWLAALVSIGLGAAERCPPDRGTGFDRLWSYAILYCSDSNTVVRELALSGRLQGDLMYFDADQGDFDDALWRRFRFGFKAHLLQNWTLDLEADFDLNDDAEERYGRLSDAKLTWTGAEDFEVALLKQSAGFTLDGATSSKKLFTMQRNNLTNNLWFTSEYFTGISVSGDAGPDTQYKVGVFSSDGDDELSKFDGSYFTLLSLGRDFADSLTLDKAVLRVDYVYNDKHRYADTRDLSHVVSISSQLASGAWELATDLGYGNGHFGQSDLWGLVLMPMYNVSEKLQWLLRYTWLRSDDSNGLRLARYEREIVDGRGELYNELYGGVNIFFYGHKLKWQTGLQYTVMDDDADDGGEYEGWGVSTGLRLSW